MSAAHPPHPPHNAGNGGMYTNGMKKGWSFLIKLPLIVYVIVALFLIYFFDGLAALGNPWFVLMVASVVVAGLGAKFAPYSNGSQLAGHSWWRNYGITILTCVVMVWLVFIPLGFSDFWHSVDDPIFWLGAPLLVGILILLMPDHLPAGAMLPWGPLIGTAALMMRWGFWLVAQGRENPTLVFTSPVERWISNAVFSIGAVGVGAVVTGYIVVILLLARKMYHGKFLLRPLNPNTVFVCQAKVGQFIFIGDASGLHVHEHVDHDVAEQARRKFDFHALHDEMIWGHRKHAPPFDTLRWTEAEWLEWYTQDDDHHGTSRLTTLAERLDVAAYFTPGRMVLPHAFFPGFPGFVTPFDHIEEGFEPVHHGHGMGPEYIDLRPKPPRVQTSAQIVFEHGFEGTITVSYRVRPVLLDLVIEADGREKLLQDAVRNAMNQIAQTVGPWLYGFLGNPTANPARGGVQHGLVVQAPARPPTPFTRRTSMVHPDPAQALVPSGQPRAGLPNLVPADRPPFQMVQAILICLTITVLKQTGLHLFDFQIDDVDVPAEVKTVLNTAVAAVIANSVLPETATLEKAAMEARIAGIYEALAKPRPGMTPLSREEITEIMVSAVKLLPGWKGDTSGLLSMAMASNLTK